ncbi:MAG: ATP-binding protein [Candidatus Aminicenantes bacterium]|nr:ATP-binding protein [Candidatus Aminicenantes bacterium]MDH5743698.1 ATP-binding protein [Candidatus Aminicenantes bacterium]
MADPKKKGPRFVAAFIIFLIILFFTIEFFIREAQEFSPTSFTNILLTFLQIIVLLMFLILLFVLGRNLAKLYLERKRKVLGARFKTKLLLFFIALSLIPTLLLFFFASDLISRNIETWFKTPIDRILDDTKSLADGFYISGEEITLHYAKQLSRAIQQQNLIDLNRRLPLMEFVRYKLTEYKLDEIGIFLDDEELFTYLNPDLPFQDYSDIRKNNVRIAHLGETYSSIDPMGNGEMIRRGISFNIPNVGNVLVLTGKFLPQNYAEKINNISAYVQRYSQLRIQKNPVKAFYFITLIFITLLIVFAASWIGFHLAKGITVPIEKLAHATKEVSRGNLNVRVEDPASDELGILIDSFNQMIFDLKDSHHNIAQKTSELEARKQYIETILNNITTGVITLDAEGIITTINPSAHTMLGLEEKNLIGKSYKNVLEDEKYGEILENIMRGLQKKHKVSDKEININFDSQSITIALTLSPLTQANNEFSGMIVVLDNLTQLIKAQKIAAWKEIAQRVAHEIKNPLTPIQLSAERIIKNLRTNKRKSNEIIEEGASTIVQEARTIKSLVDEFSSFARMPSIRLQSADLNAIIKQTISLFSGIFSEIEFETLYSTEVPSPLLIDPEQMRRVFINLIDNAIDAMNKKGKIRIRTTFDKIQQKVKIEVADFGPGIPQGEREKLFHPHYSTKKKGTGLGLAIVNQVISEHNGSIEVEDNKPHGAMFVIQIPT